MNDILFSYLDSDSLFSSIKHLGWWKINAITRGSLAAHSHKGVFEFCLIKSGKAVWWAGENIYELSGNDLYMTWPGEVHGGMDDVLDICEIYWVQFDFEKTFPGLTYDEQNKIILILQSIKCRTATSSPRILDLFKQLINHHRAPQDFAQLQVRNLSSQLIIEIITCFENSTNAGSRRIHSPQITSVLDSIRENFCNDIAIDDLASQIKLSATAFRQKFKNETGITPLAYINHQRIKKAKYMLEETKDNITEIAMTCGFQTSQYFATVFKRLTAMSPAEFRRSKR